MVHNIKKVIMKDDSADNLVIALIFLAAIAGSFAGYAGIFIALTLIGIVIIIQGSVIIIKVSIQVSRWIEHILEKVLWKINWDKEWRNLWDKIQGINHSLRTKLNLVWESSWDRGRKINYKAVILFSFLIIDLILVWISIIYLLEFVE